MYIITIGLLGSVLAGGRLCYTGTEPAEPAEPAGLPGLPEMTGVAR
jgi:hypothetical protein